MVYQAKAALGEVKVGIIGKYFNSGDFTLEDSYISVMEAIKHACYLNAVRPNIHWINSADFEKNRKKVVELADYDAIIIPGGFGANGVEGKIEAIKYARENKIPFLGLCYGMQLAVVEHARHLCDMPGAHTTEIEKKTKFPVIDILPEQKLNVEEKHYGATMRLGDYTAKLTKGSRVQKIYGKDFVVERHRHRYEVNPEYVDLLQQKGLVFSGVSPDRKLMEFMERTDHPYFIATQAHPEFTSRPLRPNPLFDGLIKAAMHRKG
jgi:CTP synthase